MDAPWDGRVCAYAAEGGHFEVLKWARENGVLGISWFVLMLLKMVISKY